MKKLAAILLITLFLFNLFGYRILFYYAQQKSDSKLEDNFDKNIYNEDELIAISIPLSIPYQQNSDGFERCDGEITLNGQIFKYVKRKYCNGILTILCLPDHYKMRLEIEKNDLSQFGNGLVQNKSSESGSSKTISIKNIISEYDKSKMFLIAAFYKYIKVAPFSNEATRLTDATYPSPWQPPELA